MGWRVWYMYLLFSSWYEIARSILIRLYWRFQTKQRLIYLGQAFEFVTVYVLRCSQQCRKTDYSKQGCKMIPIKPVGNYMFKVNNRNTKTRCKISEANSVILVSLLLTLTYFTPCSSVSIVNFEQVNAG